MDSHEAELWTRCAAGDRRAREALVLLHAAWSRLVARDVFMKVRRFQVSWQDCTQNAMVGLLEAVDRYRPEHGVNFQTYARHRVRGAVFNGLRSVRDVLLDEQMVAQRTTDRFDSLREGVDDDPVDRFVGLTVGLGLAFLLDALPEDELDTTPPGMYASQANERVIDRVATHLQDLPERERNIVTLHYFHYLPFVEIAARLGVSKGRVSQLHHRALDMLRESLVRSRLTMVF